MNRRWTWVVAVTGMALATEAVWASWAYVPPIQRVAEADLIVAGKMGKIGEDFQRGNRILAIGTIQVGEVLKGDKSVKTARLALASPNRKAWSSIDIEFKEGQEGVWLLRRDTQGGPGRGHCGRKGSLQGDGQSSGWRGDRRFPR